jgi:hypothetical protein
MSVGDWYRQVATLRGELLDLVDEIRAHRSTVSWSWLAAGGFRGVTVENFSDVMAAVSDEVERLLDGKVHWHTM